MKALDNQTIAKNYYYNISEDTNQFLHRDTKKEWKELRPFEREIFIEHIETFIRTMDVIAKGEGIEEEPPMLEPPPQKVG